MRSVVFASLWLFVFAMPWENALVLPGIGTFSRLLGLVAAGAGLMWVVIQGRARRPSGFLIVTALFLLWGMTTTFWTIDQYHTVLRGKTYAQLAIMVWLLWEFAGSRDRHSSALHAYVLGASCTAVATIWSYITGANSLDGRYTAVGFNANDLAMVLVIAIPIAWHLGMDARNAFLRWTNLMHLPLALAGVVLTASRGAFIAGLVALSIVPLSIGRLRLRDKGLIAVFIAVSVCILIATTPESSWERFGTTGSELESGDISHRGAIWAAGLRVFMQHPLVGIGVGAYSESVLGELGRAFAAHNSFLAVLVEQGVLGFTLFLILFLFALRPWDRFSGPDLRFRLVLFATLVVGLMPLSWDYAKPTWFILAMLASQPPRPRDAPASRPLRDAAPDYTALAAWRGNVRGPNRAPRPSIGAGR